MPFRCIARFSPLQVTLLSMSQWCGAIDRRKRSTMGVRKRIVHQKSSQSVFTVSIGSPPEQNPRIHFPFM
ncbi:MAG: hypothetical protein ACLUDU_12110 [Butyricimonas faecihominis]